jgi:ankyrin repeat protein
MHRLPLTIVLLATVASSACSSAVAASYPLTPLAAASRAGDLATIDRLLADGADVNLGSGVNGWSPAMHAVHKNQSAALARLMDHGATLTGEAGRRALQMATGYGDVETVRVLLAHHVAPPSDSARDLLQRARP